VLFQKFVVLGSANLRDIDLLASEPLWQEAFCEAIVVNQISLLELDEGISAQVAQWSFNSILWLFCKWCLHYSF